MDASLSPVEILERFKRLRRVVLVAFAVPAFAFFLAIFAGVVLGWPKTVLLSCFAACAVLAGISYFSLRCPNCHSLVQDSEGGPNFRARACGKCGAALR